MPPLARSGAYKRLLSSQGDDRQRLVCQVYLPTAVPIRRHGHIGQLPVQRGGNRRALVMPVIVTKSNHHARSVDVSDVPARETGFRSRGRADGSSVRWYVFFVTPLF